MTVQQHVAVVDDDPMVRSMLEEFLIDEGYEVIAEDDTGEFVYDTDFGGERFCPTKAEIFAALDELASLDKDGRLLGLPA